MSEDVLAARKRIKEFMEGPERYLKIPYEGPELNPRIWWHGVVVQNKLKFLWRSFIIAICTLLPAGEFKNKRLRSIGMNIGREAFIAPLVFLDVEFPTLLTIGEGAVVGTMTKILTHEVTIKSIRLGKTEIGKQALVGVGCVLRCGVSIGEGAVVSMNSFVNQDVLPYHVVGGSPLQDIKTLDKLI